MSAQAYVVKMFVSRICPYCKQAESYLEKLGFTTINKVFVDGDDALRQKLMADTGQRTVPQIYIDEQHIGGYTDLVAAHQAGKLNCFLKDE